MAKNSINVVSLTLGYVESARVSHFILQSQTKFKNKKDAFESLTKYLFNFYLDKFELSFDSLLNKPNNCKGCSCGIPCSKKQRGSIEHFSEFIHYLIESDSDYYSDQNVENPDEWSPFDFQFECKKENVLNVYEQALDVILVQLSLIYPELKIDNQIMSTNLYNRLMN